MGAMGRFRSRLRECQSGNALMLTSVAIPLLLGGVGYGVDTAQMYMLKRELQYAADQGAIAGAWTLAYKDTGSAYDDRATTEFANNIGKAKKFVASVTPVIDRGDYQGGNDNTVIVSAAVQVNLPFGKLLSSTPTTIKVSSEAAFAAGTVHKACLRTLKKDADDTFTVGNGATVIANCGVIAISCEKGAINIAENATISIAKITACNKDAAILPSTYTGELVLDNTINNYTNDLFGPAPSESEKTMTYNCPKGSKKGTYTINPGLYAGGIQIACDTFLNPGIYYVKNQLDLTHNAVVAGYKVMFVLLNGATLKLGGSGANKDETRSSLNLTPPTYANLIDLGYSAAFATKYENILIISDDTPTEVDHIINGNANMHIQGKMHLPKGNVKVNGNAQAADGVCFQITSYTLDVTGGAYLYTLCNQNETQSLSSKPGVRLIS